MTNVLLCDGFFDCASVLTKSVAEVTFRLVYILDVAFVALYHINEIGRRAGDVMSYTSLFVGRENRARRGSLCNERTRLAPLAVTTGSSRSRGKGPCLNAVFGSDQYVTSVFAAAARYARSRTCF